jgi:hypothetical protein
MLFWSRYENLLRVTAVAIRQRGLDLIEQGR